MRIRCEYTPQARQRREGGRPQLSGAHSANVAQAVKYTVVSINFAALRMLYSACVIRTRI